MEVKEFNTKRSCGLTEGHGILPLLSKPKGLYLLSEIAFSKIYGDQERQDIGKLVEIGDERVAREDILRNSSVYADTEIIFSGWGCPLLDDELLDCFPKLKIVFYGAGTLRFMVTPTFWQRGIRVSSAWKLNSIPVAEYNLAQTIFALKRIWQVALTRRDPNAAIHTQKSLGTYDATIGIVSLGMAGRLFRKLLHVLDVQVLAYDPYVSEQDARELGVRLVSLEELFEKADVVSVNTPLLPETVGLISGDLIRRMKSGATLLNTSRGAIIKENELVEVLEDRGDLWAVLDVTDPEPPEADSRLLKLPNIILTPHIAGSQGNECRRMGRGMLEECQRYLKNETLFWEVTEEQAKVMA